MLSSDTPNPVTIHDIWVASVQSCHPVPSTFSWTFHKLKSALWSDPITRLEIKMSKYLKNILTTALALQACNVSPQPAIRRVTVDAQQLPGGFSMVGKRVR